MNNPIDSFWSFMDSLDAPQNRDSRASSRYRRPVDPRAQSLSDPLKEEYLRPADPSHSLKDVDPMHFDALQRSRLAALIPSQREELQELQDEVEQLRMERVLADYKKEEEKMSAEARVRRRQELIEADLNTETLLHVGVYRHIMPPSLRDHLENCKMQSPEMLPARELSYIDCKHLDNQTYKWTYKPLGQPAMPAMILHAFGQHDTSKGPVQVPYWAEPDLPPLPSGWQMVKDIKGKPAYVNHDLKASSRVYDPMSFSSMAIPTRSHDPLGFEELETRLVMPKTDMSTELTTSEGRLATFNPLSAWPHPTLAAPYLSPLELAQNGFYYNPTALGGMDRVKCAFCGLELHNFQISDDPKQMHKNSAPYCKFVKEEEERQLMLVRQSWTNPTQRLQHQISPPPPPPVALPQENGGMQAVPTIEAKQAIAHTHFNGRGEDELTFVQGDAIVIFDQAEDEGWWMGALKSKQHDIRLVPGTHITFSSSPPTSPLGAPAASRPAGNSPATPASRPPNDPTVTPGTATRDGAPATPAPGHVPEGHIRALHPYVKRNKDELSFMPGDVIELIRMDAEPGWHVGKFNGEMGLVPTTHVVAATKPVASPRNTTARPPNAINTPTYPAVSSSSTPAANIVPQASSNPKPQSPKDYPLVQPTLLQQSASVRSQQQGTLSRQDSAKRVLHMSAPDSPTQSAGSRGQAPSVGSRGGAPSVGSRGPTPALQFLPESDVPPAASTVQSVPAAQAEVDLVESAPTYEAAFVAPIAQGATAQGAPGGRTESEAPSQGSAHDSRQGGSPRVPLGHVRALFPYAARNKDEITFEAGAFIEVETMNVEPGWHLGRYNGQTGLVPTTHVAFK